ncbi:Tcp11-domain-containing protein [Teratosphaeria nubilosa]|uniref:Tcp11-domain-containing protein n=1 Tax=Teratosphaeria nubilosa TaxID=161662 RepID=A0A6G1LC33_9PEZI|nr:Tcp11-domain-containing protein [Teratosphaeria nubilosa]
MIKDDVFNYILTHYDKHYEKNAGQNNDSSIDLNPWAYAGTDNEPAACAFEKANRHPPITPETLVELDMSRIINNPKLRHDINFDRDLHFRANTEGPRGEEKKMSAERYWRALEAEFFMYCFAGMHRHEAPPDLEDGPDYWERVMKASQKRLPKLLRVARDILKTLVPDYEQRAITARLDASFIMQEITKGVCDLVDLSNWLAKVLKKHCAPMRDALVDSMQANMQEGAVNNNCAQLVKGLRKLLLALEGMKIDVANHQIRHMRLILVDDTVNFQIRYNAHRIAIGKVDAGKARRWLDDEIEGLMCSGKSNPSPLEAMSSGMMRELLFNDAQPGPPTFYLDFGRLQSLKSELHRRVSYQLCNDIMKECCAPNIHPNILLQKQAELSLTIYAILQDTEAHSFILAVPNIAVAILQGILEMESRYPPWDGTMLPMIEMKLTAALNPTSQAFDKLARDTCERLLEKVYASVEKHRHLNAVQLQDVFVPQPPPPSSVVIGGIGAVCAPPPHQVQWDPEEEFVRKITHVLCLHWQVWADLVYLADDQYATPSSPAFGPTSPNASASPTMPVAQAVYAPGRKWLPVGVTVTEVPSQVASPSPIPIPIQQHEDVDDLDGPTELGELEPQQD